MDDKTVNDLTSGCMYFIFIVCSVGSGILASVAVCKLAAFILGL
jgi:hypothetical protein